MGSDSLLITNNLVFSVAYIKVIVSKTSLFLNMQSQLSVLIFLKFVKFKIESNQKMLKVVLCTVTNFFCFFFICSHFLCHTFSVFHFIIQLCFFFIFYVIFSYGVGFYNKSFFYLKSINLNISFVASTCDHFLLKESYSY